MTKVSLDPPLLTVSIIPFLVYRVARESENAFIVYLTIWDFTHTHGGHLICDDKTPSFSLSGPLCRSIHVYLGRVKSTCLCGGSADFELVQEDIVLALQPLSRASPSCDHVKQFAVAEDALPTDNLSPFADQNRNLRV